MESYRDMFRVILELSNDKAASSVYFMLVVSCVTARSHYRRLKSNSSEVVTALQKKIPVHPYVHSLTGVKVYYLDGYHVSLEITKETTIKDICSQILHDTKIGLYEVENEFGPSQDHRLLPADMTMGELVERWKFQNWPDAKLVAPLYLRNWHCSPHAKGPRHVRFDNSHLSRASPLIHHSPNKNGILAILSSSPSSVTSSPSPQQSPLSSNLAGTSPYIEFSNTADTDLITVSPSAATTSPVRTPLLAPATPSTSGSKKARESPASRAHVRTHALANSLFSSEEDTTAAAPRTSPGTPSSAERSNGKESARRNAPTRRQNSSHALTPTRTVSTPTGSTVASPAAVTSVSTPSLVSFVPSSAESVAPGTSIETNFDGSRSDEVAARPVTMLPVESSPDSLTQPAHSLSPPVSSVRNSSQMNSPGMQALLASVPDNLASLEKIRPRTTYVHLAGVSPLSSPMDPAARSLLSAYTDQSQAFDPYPPSLHRNSTLLLTTAASVLQRRGEDDSPTTTSSTNNSAASTPVGFTGLSPSSSFRSAASAELPPLPPQQAPAPPSSPGSHVLLTRLFGRPELSDVSRPLSPITTSQYHSPPRQRITVEDWDRTYNRSASPTPSVSSCGDSISVSSGGTKRVRKICTPLVRPPFDTTYNSPAVSQLISSGAAIAGEELAASEGDTARGTLPRAGSAQRGHIISNNDTPTRGKRPATPVLAGTAHANSASKSVRRPTAASAPTAQPTAVTSESEASAKSLGGQLRSAARGTTRRSSALSTPGSATNKSSSANNTPASTNTKARRGQQSGVHGVRRSGTSSSAATTPVAAVTSDVLSGHYKGTYAQVFGGNMPIKRPTPTKEAEDSEHSHLDSSASDHHRDHSELHRNHHDHYNLHHDQHSSQPHHGNTHHHHQNHLENHHGNHHANHPHQQQQDDDNKAALRRVRARSTSPHSVISNASSSGGGGGQGRGSRPTSVSRHRKTSNWIP